MQPQMQGPIGSTLKLVRELTARAGVDVDELELAQNIAANLAPDLRAALVDELAELELGLDVSELVVGVLERLAENVSEPLAA